MMSPDNPPVKPASNEEETQNMSGERKTGSTRAQQQALKCPRCHSPNTKFCYYNNYSLTQPRHFCKTCRRYWTRGGALRNVPIGGVCRKSKKVIKSSSRLLLPGYSKEPTSSSSEMGGLKLFHGLSPHALDFQFGGLSFPRPSPSPAGIYNQFTSHSFTLDPSGRSGSLMGFSNYPLSSVISGLSGAIQEMGSLNVSNSVASSIESLSSINQDLHWKLQQQRLAMIFGGDQNQKETSTILSSSVQFENQAKKPEPNSFQNLKVSKPEISAVQNPRNGGSTSNEAATEWFFGAPVTPTPATTSTSCSNGNDNITSNWIGVQAWNHDLHHQYRTLP